MRVQSLTLGVCVKKGVSISVSVKGLSEIFNFFSYELGCITRCKATQHRMLRSIEEINAQARTAMANQLSLQKVTSEHMDAEGCKLVSSCSSFKCLHALYRVKEALKSEHRL